MASKDDDFDKESLEALKGKGKESFLEERKRKKEAEYTAKLLERDPLTRASNDKHADLDGDGITWIDKEYNEKLNARHEIDLEGDGITWYDLERDESRQFFNQPNAKADYEHWGKVAFYNPEEATALLLGKAPEIVTLESTKPLIQEFDFPKTYKKICTLIERAVIAKELRSLESLIKPTDLLDWARLNQLDIPKELIDAIEGDSICMKTEESTAKKLERDPLTRTSNEKVIREDIDLDGDGLIWIDKDYDERFGEVPFYEKPNAAADYGHWGKVPLWTSADAASLLFGKDPQIVTPDSIQPYIQSSGFPKKYMQLYTLIDRAVSAGELQSESNLIKPIDLLDWAGKHNISVPNELLSSIGESITPNDDAPPENPFPSMENLQWRELSMIIVADEKAQLMARKKRVLVTYAEMGFKNKRDAKPTKAWEAILNQFANTDTGAKKDFDVNLKSRVKEIRKVFKNYFKIDSDPFFPYKDGKWVPRIRIYDNRGSIDYPFEFEGDAADQWLRDND
ncbi:MAG: hypothetical protein N0C81_03115 [Candidatus Thiodiazotropha lotti]|nr:hypothetical protein [Candidatus Thiodiazotropha lotti]ODB94684.1 hypothetical protein A3197_18210 [Candidatus Thiodiazotropha endoloripes]MCG8004606.1 hypothetical protein [Candidatus Thiodiazotropha lotti]MCG8006624.1 hypothetical protein [Candidatus Thiodiazotropha lotti]MCW4188233.1 hypothetical protein [Candidatus Thiodiazotropha lotti]